MGVLECGADPRSPAFCGGRLMTADPGVITVKEVFVFIYCTDLPFTFSTPGAGEVNTSFSRGGGSHPGNMPNRPLSFGNLNR